MAAALAEISHTLTALMPTARGSGQALGSERVTCLSCKQRVRSSLDMTQLLRSVTEGPGFHKAAIARAVSPELLPAPDGMASRKPLSPSEPTGVESIDTYV